MTPRRRFATGALLAAIALAACGPNRDAGAGSEQGALSARSVWQIDTVWLASDDRPVELAEFRGEVVVAAMMFTSCVYACPRLVDDLRLIQDALSPSERARVRFLLVSLDHERDLPPVLSAWSSERGLDDRWTLLHGDADPVRELAAVLGVRYVFATGGAISHSNLVTVLDAEGRVVHRQEGLEADHSATLQTIRELLRAR